MGTFREQITLVEKNKKITIEALVDTGATYTWVPKHFLTKIGVKPVKKSKLRIANGSVIERNMGEVHISVRGETCTTWVIFGDKNSETLLGAYSLEGLGFAADPVHRTLVPAINYLMFFKK